MDDLYGDTNTAPEDERLLLVRRLIETEREVEQIEHEINELRIRLDDAQASCNKRREVRRGIIDQLGDRLELTSAKAMKPADLTLRPVNQEAPRPW
jgi:hypothetical protein